mmetsp:Transcript_12020/g.16626  ORF Transcript_12020/g.16626 Transcript_12020/m.16626 type:complete len:218 (-) Transcript_12020:5-658(-)
MGASSRLFLRKAGVVSHCNDDASPSSCSNDNNNNNNHKHQQHLYHAIRQKAWEVAYKHIYAKPTIERYFLGECVEKRTWDCVDCTMEETLLVCAPIATNDKEEKEEGGKEEKVVGYAKWGWTPRSKGELHSLYVLPQYWNLGGGSMLWDCIMTTCCEEQVESLDIWVLDRARSGEFYSSRGCRRVGDGDYYIGDHMELAVCYRWLSSSSSNGSCMEI